MKKTNKKVYVGMSGGVDSSVSAAILKSKGYDVIGVFIKIWQPDWIECTWRTDREDAMRVAAKLNIPFKTLDLTETYKKRVVEYMIDEYAKGRTPNPDVMCNRHVKFGDFYNWAMAQGADYVATGHYASICTVPSQDKKSKISILVPGADKNKDQSYFLWTLTASELDHVLFPVGDVLKSQVRKLAKKYELPNATKKDSQGLCFIGKVDIKEFIARYSAVKPGNILDVNGNIIGRHDGAILYTIGERHGFTITTNTPNSKPYFVISKDVNTNTITVDHRATLSENNPKANKPQQIILENENIHRFAIEYENQAIQNGIDVLVRTRYRADLLKAKLRYDLAKKAYAIDLIDPASDLATGQSAVIYMNVPNQPILCVGGGVIAAVF